MTHAEAWDQIPWLVNGSLDETAAGNLERHLAQCAECREETRLQRALLQAMNSGPSVEAMPPASLQKLWARIDAGRPPAASGAVPATGMRRPASGFRFAAVALAALLAGAALMSLVQQLDEAEYRTVSEAPAAASGDLRVVFAGEMTLQGLQELLERTGLHIVAGPSASGVYTLAGEDARGALEVLRADPQVRFAEPVDPRSLPP